jgi:hypothetical protein
MAKMTDESRRLTKDMKIYEDLCVAEVDVHNRENDDDCTVAEARKSRNFLTYPTFDDYLNDKYPERARRQARREAQAKAREEFMTLPLSQRFKFQAISEMAGCLRIHSENMKELDSALEEEMEQEMGMGDWG